MQTTTDISQTCDFYQRMNRLIQDNAWKKGIQAQDNRVREALAAYVLSPDDFLALISPVGEKYLEQTARKARQITQQQFGRVVELFTPLYLSNLCANHCVYCGFNSRHRISRHTLTLDEVEKEALSIKATGLRSILALTGDAHRKTGPDYLASCVKVLARHFSSVGIEVPSMTVDEYRQVIAAGVSSVTLFQETYNESLYATLHPAGPKRDFLFRLNAPQRTAEAGVRSLNFGVLLGLDDWRRDVFLMGMHAAFLQRRFPSLSVNFSLPRLRPCGDEPTDDTFVPKMVTDKNLVQALVALRCFLPQAGITISTRESPALRDKLIPLGVTRVSAGVSTAVGGYVMKKNDTENTPQFVISDDRTVQQMAQTITGLGYQPVYSDWLLTDQGISDLSPALMKTLGNIHESAA